VTEKNGAICFFFWRDFSSEATKKSAQHTIKPEGTERDNQLQKKRGALKFPFFFAAGIAL
jgi:hypothetical protein